MKLSLLILLIGCKLSAQESFIGRDIKSITYETLNTSGLPTALVKGKYGKNILIFNQDTCNLQFLYPYKDKNIIIEIILDNSCVKVSHNKWETNKYSIHYHKGYYVFDKK